MKQLLFALYLMFLTVHIQAEDINATIINGNKAQYQKLLSTLNKETSPSSELALQRSLLKALIDHTSKEINATAAVPVPKNSESYRLLFHAYIEDAIVSQNLKNKWLTSQKKIKTIEAEIQKIDKKSEKLLSLELQDALYHQNAILYQKKIDIYHKKMQKSAELLLSSLKYTEIDYSTIFKVLEKKKLLLEKLHYDINTLQIKKEQAALIQNNKKITSFNEKNRSLKYLYEDTVKVIASYDFLLFSKALQNQSNDAFKLEKKIIEELKNISEFKNIRHTILALLTSMEKKYLGQIKTLEGSGIQDFEDIVYQGVEFINRPIFKINHTPVSIFKIFMAFFILGVGFILGGVYKNKIENLNLSKRSLPASTRIILANIGYYIILLIALFMVLNVLGIRLSSLALVAGALSVGMGFGLKNIVSNFVSGLIMMFEHSVKIGDYVQLEDGICGYITDIRMRSTTINTNDNIDVIVPNQNFIETNVINWTMKDNIRRFAIPFGVKYGTNPQTVIDVITNAVKNEDKFTNVIHESAERTTRIIMTKMGSSSVDFELLVWVSGIKMRRPKRTTSEFLILIYNALYENNIEIPFPQVDLHVRSVDTPIPVEDSMHHSH